MMRKGLLALAGLMGAAGVAAAAAGAHLGYANFPVAAQFLMLHAVAVAALVAIRPFGSRLLDIAAAILVLGTLSFSGGLMCTDAFGAPPFPHAAPFGGTALILGWLFVAAAAFTLRRSAS